MHQKLCTIPCLRSLPSLPLLLLLNCQGEESLPTIGMYEDDSDRKDHVDDSFWYKSDFIIVRRFENVINYINKD
jgi:hypothetical protein